MHDTTFAARKPYLQEQLIRGEQAARQQRYKHDSKPGNPEGAPLKTPSNRATQMDPMRERMRNLPKAQLEYVGPAPQRPFESKEEVKVETIQQDEIFASNKCSPRNKEWSGLGI